MRKIPKVQTVNYIYLVGSTIVLPMTEGDVLRVFRNMLNPNSIIEGAVVEDLTFTADPDRPGEGIVGGIEAEDVYTYTITGLIDARKFTRFQGEILYSKFVARRLGDQELVDAINAAIIDNPGASYLMFPDGRAVTYRPIGELTKMRDEAMHRLAKPAGMTGWILR